MRALIERRLSEVGGRAGLRPERGDFANVEGPLSAELRQELARDNHEAAVLLGLIERTAGLTVLFTERAAHLKHHPGQVSFPGGRLKDASEAPTDAALREAWEEVGLPPADVTIAGRLPRYITGTGFAVTPVVGFISGGFEPRPDPAEVSAVFEVPLEYLRDRRNVRRLYRERFGTRFRVYELDYRGHRIWGATAAMLSGFMELISYGKT